MRARISLLSLLRVVLVVLTAAISAVILPHISWLEAGGPDLVLLVVVAAALLGGSPKGALLGLVAGWTVDLMPPAAPALGVTALTYAVAGAVAGLWHREGGRSVSLPVVATVAAASTVEAIGILRALTSDRTVAWSAAGWSIVLTTAVGLAVVPLLIRVERGLIRRRLA